MFGTRWWGVTILAILLMTTALSSSALAEGSDQDVISSLATMSQHVQSARAAIASNDLTTARADGVAIERTWESIESTVAQRYPRAESEVDEALDQFNEGMAQTSPSADVTQKIDRLQAAVEQLTRDVQSGTAEPSPLIGREGIAREIGYLRAADKDLDEGDVASARQAFQTFRDQWPTIEGSIAASSPSAYRKIESTMPAVAEALAASPTDVSTARQGIGELVSSMDPLAVQPEHYGPVDAAITLLREGLEALLIIGALLALVTRSGRPDLRWHVWLGGGAGILASLLVAAGLQIAFSRFVVGLNREVLEGFTGLGAAGMLLYVSYWLHQQGNLADWRKFLASRTGAAITSGNVFVLSSLAFLAVFREGAETILLYVGMAAAISLRDLIVGMGLGLFALAVVGVGLFGFGLRLSMKPFFRVISVLLYYLAFKFVGTGIHALQVAGLLPATSADYLPSIDAVGMFPTWQTTLAQGVLLAIAFAVVVWVVVDQRSNRPRAESA